MSFDPLTFFEPEPPKFEIEEISDTGNFNHGKSERFSNQEFTDDLEENDEYVLLHILDLPQPNPQLPYSILKTILQLFQPDQVKNFGNNESVNLFQFKDDELGSYLEEKSISLEEAKALASYLNYNLQSVLTIVQLPKFSSTSTTSFLTKIIAYPFENYTEDERDDIYDLASYVMTASSAPAMKGNTTRLVELDGLEKSILLYEPALTEDKVGNITWGASHELAKQIVNNNAKKWLSKTEIPILELGAGTGLVTIVLGLLKYRVVSTDLPEIIDNLKKNVELNQLECIKLQDTESIVNNSLIHLTSLDWRSPYEFLSRTSCLGGYPIVILSDPVYSSQHPFWVRDTVKAVLSRDPASKLVFMIGRRDRFQDVRDNLWNLILKLGLRELQSDIVNGFDDYGILEYDYKVFGW